MRSYRDSLKPLLAFAAGRTGREPMHMDVEDIDAGPVCRFLDHLETGRGNGVGSRNIRLAAIRSLFTHISRREPALPGHCRKIGMLPGKRRPRPTVQHLDGAEIQALLDAPDLHTRTGRRDRAILLLLVRTGLRVGELTGLDRGSVRPGGQASVFCRGKGRRERLTPLRRDTVQVPGEWMRERPGGDGDPLFVSNRNRRLSPDSVQRLVRRHAERAAGRCPVPPGEEDQSAQPSAHRRDGASAPWQVDRRHRPLARTRVDRDDDEIPACRPKAQAGGHGTHAAG